MGQVFIHQTYVKIEANVKVNISSITTVKIKFFKPSGTEGEFIGVVEDVAGIIKYVVMSENDLDEYGTWILWGFVIFSDGRSAPGEPFKYKVFKEGEFC